MKRQLSSSGLFRFFSLGSDASVLMLALWAMSLLAFFAVTMGFSSRARLMMMDRLRQRAQLRLVAEAGVARAKAELEKNDMDPQVDSFREPWANNEGLFRRVKVGPASFDIGADPYYGAVDEESKINLNTASADTLRRLFMVAARLSEVDAAALAEALMDWRDKDDEPKPKGAENSYYQGLSRPYDCKNAPMDSIDELLLVRGGTSKVAEDCKPYITVWGSGAVNINTASAIVFEACGFEAPLVGKIMEFRRGEDGVLGNEDDRFIAEAGSFRGQVESYVRLTDEEKQDFDAAATSMNGTVKSTAFSVTSHAAYDVKKGDFVITAVFDRAPLENGRGYAVRCVSWRTQG
jgi:general secretion pathway protein K